MKIIHLSFPFIAILLLASCSKESSLIEEPEPPPPTESRIETFTFTSNAVDTKGKIFLPASYVTDSNLPSIYLIDFKEQHFEVATDEFEQVVKGVQQILNSDALVVTLDVHPDIDANPNGFQGYYDVFKDMTSYVDKIYTNNTSRTFIGRGSEAGVVLLTLLREDPETSVFDNFIATDSPHTFNNVVTLLFQNDDYPENISGKKLHFSFSSDNNYASCTALINVIEEKQYPWLTFESIEYPNDIYENVYTYSFAAGIRFVFDK